MFKKLRNKFILLNLISTSIILLISYSAIYIVAKNSAESRKPIPAEVTIENGDTSITFQDPAYRNEIEERVLADRKLALRNLLFALIATGLSVEVFVFAFSCLFADEAIKPVEQAYKTQKIFIANASHEIKTPIAAIKANLEAADLSSKNHWIKNIETEAEKIETLNLALLKLARSDIIKESITSESISLKPFLEKTISSFDSRINQKKIVLKTSFKPETKKPIKLNKVDFEEIVTILIDNAIKYCAKKITIDVSSKSFSIENDGKTIPEENLAHIFDRFYQVDKSSEGSGLGLAIADSLARRNDWSLKASSTPASTTFVLTFN
ncbi:HAMP domain-containing histidine kinase [Candidatus Saccharibacteria bacterium]|nr:HAMP domain-containing histidine kinase [Candidatus Saccharibacteria bacterium]